LTAALRQGRGSARDALSALDQVAAGGVVVEEEPTLAPVLGALADRDVAAALSAVDAAVRAGRDPQLLAVDLVERLRRAFFLVVAPALRPPGERAPEPGELEAASALGTGRIVRGIEVLGAATVAMRDAPEPRIALEVALVRLAHPEADDSPAALVERLERLERRFADVQPAPPAPSASVPAAPPARSAPPSPSSGPPPPVAAPAPPSPGPAQPPGASGGERPVGGRPALGAFRRGAAAVGSPPPSPEAGPPSPEASPPPTEASPGAGGDGGAGEGPLAPTVEGSPAAPPTAAAPSRDELVAAWGDQVLVGLRAKVRAIFQAGRFVGGGPDGAIFALPNEAHLVHAEPLRVEVAEALGRHLGVPVPLRLVVDPGTGGSGKGEALGAPGDEPAPPAPPAPPAGSVPTAGGSPPAGGNEGLLDDPEEHEVDDLAEGPSGPAGGITWAEDRLRKAFPGAEEV
jgi:DNA polymerase-3 subunit gamma/tau